MENQENIIPDILTQTSKEKFRRKLLIISRILALLLILVIFYFGYTNFKYGELVSRSPCYACGYFEGKKCDIIYVDYNALSDKKNFLKTLGEWNELKNYSTFKENTIYQNINLSRFNFTK